MKKLGLVVFIMAATGMVLLTFTCNAISQTKPVELKLAQWDPPGSLPAQMTQKMVDRINEKAAGRLKVTPYYGETLIKQAEHYRSTQLGVADMAYYGPNTISSPIVLGKVISLPFLGITSHEMGAEVYDKLIRQSPELNAEYKGLRVMGVFGIPLDNFHLVKKSVHVPADVKGMKIATVGQRVDFIKAIGAVPVTMGLGDWYTSLERGVIEGLYFLFPVLPVFKGEDLFKYHTVVNASLGVNFWIFNEKKWNTIPTDLQKIIEEAANWRAHEMMKTDRVEEQKVVASLKNKKHEVYYPTAEEMKLWQAAAKPIHEAWIADLEKKGLPAKRVFDQTMKAIEEHKK